MKESYLKQIPAVNDLLELDFGKKLTEIYSHRLVVNGIREVTDKLRNEILNTDLEELEHSHFNLSSKKVLAEVERFLVNNKKLKLEPAINATGVVIHTNLGRSLLSKSAQEALLAVASSYSTLEINQETGERGSRYDNVKELLHELTGAEASMVVNNNAAAVLLALSSLALDKEVIISRGQLVEIGGSFRIPDVMKQSGASLVEVGTTNKTYLSDYEEAITPETTLLLKVHTSNYKILGFTNEVRLKELVELGNRHDLPVMEDLGSGIFVDLTKYGLSYEPTVQDSIQAGADIVTISGDKLLGGPQAGIILGKKKYIDQMKKHPLNRALRVDKLTLAALEATLQVYRDSDEAKNEIPTLKMLTVPLNLLKERANRLLIKLEEILSSEFNLEIKKDSSQVGGGAFPAEVLPTYVIELSHDKLNEEFIARKLRLNHPPIFTRRYNGKVLFDLRTIKEEDFLPLIKALKKLV